MDPDEALSQQREAVAGIKQMLVDDGEVRDLVYAIGEEGVGHLRSVIEHFEALDGWLKGGGFLPQDWQKK